LREGQKISFEIKTDPRRGKSKRGKSAGLTLFARSA